MRFLSARFVFIAVVILQFLIDNVYCRAGGSSSSTGVAFRYKAKRYGGYYSTTYFSYSGGIGHARYSRVYATKKNKYPDYYARMFDWFKTPQFIIYKNTPSSYISVCRNYEANENGTYLGIFTCPLPIYPDSHTYCCGVTNAEYCCKFWDVPLNVGASIIIALMGLCLLVTLVYIIFHLKKSEHIKNVTAKRKRSIFRKIQLREFYDEISKKAKVWTNRDFFVANGAYYDQDP